MASAPATRTSTRPRSAGPPSAIDAPPLRGCRRRGPPARRCARCGRPSAIASAISATPRAQSMPAKRLADRGHRLVVAAVRSDFDRGVEFLEVAQRERRLVAVELEAAAELGRPADVEAGRQPDHRAAVELDRRDDEVRAADPERRPVDRHPVRQQVPAPRPHRPRRPEHRRDQRQRVDARRRPARRRRRTALRRRVPGLDPPVAHVGVDGADRSQAAVADPRRGGLLRLAEERRRRAPEPDARGARRPRSARGPRRAGAPSASRCRRGGRPRAPAS